MKVQINKNGECGHSCSFATFCAQHSSADSFTKSEGFAPEILDHGSDWAECDTVDQPPHPLDCDVPINEEELDFGFIKL